MAKYLLLAVGLLAPVNAAPTVPLSPSAILQTDALAPHASSRAHGESVDFQSHGTSGMNKMKMSPLFPRKEESTKEVSHPKTQKEAAGKPLYPHTINDAFMREVMKASHVDGKPVVKEELSPTAESDQAENTDGCGCCGNE